MISGTSGDLEYHEGAGIACCDDTAMLHLALHLLVAAASYAPGTHVRSQQTQRAVYTAQPRTTTIAALELAKELHGTHRRRGQRDA